MKKVLYLQSDEVEASLLSGFLAIDRRDLDLLGLALLHRLRDGHSHSGVLALSLRPENFLKSFNFNKNIYQFQT